MGCSAVLGKLDVEGAGDSSRTVIVLAVSFSSRSLRVSFDLPVMKLSQEFDDLETSAGEAATCAETLAIRAGEKLTFAVTLWLATETCWSLIGASDLAEIVDREESAAREVTGIKALGFRTS